MTQKAAKFSKGDFVYINRSNDIGQISDVHDPEEEGAAYTYRVNYCQSKDPGVGTRGGNGPVFVEGYPQEITETEDIIFVMAVNQSRKIRQLSTQVAMAEGNRDALVKVYRMMVPEPKLAALCEEEDDLEDFDEED